ncbi:MAG: GNAT family N-acetyltransferase, partial [Chloroflexota bacterium]
GYKRQVHAGPIEATALGNVMTQALAQGKVDSLEEIREIVGASFSSDVYEPSADRAACEELYAAHGLPTIVRIVDLSEPPGLDELLARRGYERIDPSEVLYRPLDDAEGHVDGALELLELDPWLAHYAELSGAPPATLPAHREILAAVPSQRALFALRDAGQVVACGMGVREGGFFGLFDIVVGAPFRRRGWGAALVSGMLGWGRRNGARHAYLQVVARNEPALALYRQLGFRQGYRYWYRVRRAARASGS